MTAEQELSYYRSIVNTGKFYIIRTDPEGNYTYANDIYIRDFYPEHKESIIGLNRLLILSPEDHHKIKRIMHECLSQPGKSFSIRLRKIAANNNSVINDWEFIATVNATGMPTEIQCIGYNLSAEEEQRSLIAEQRKEIERLYSTLDLVPVSVILTNPNAQIIYVNKSFENDTGYTAEEVIGKNPKMLGSGVTPREEYNRMWKLLNEKKIFQGQFINRKKSGELLFHQMTVAPIISSGELLGYVSSQHDITALIQRSNQYEHLLKLYENTCDISSVGGWELDLVKGQIHLTDIARDIYEVEESYILDVDNAGLFYKGEINQKKIHSCFEEAINNGQSFDDIFEFVTTKGKEKFVRVTGRSEFINGVCNKLYGSIIDVTEQHAAERKLNRVLAEVQCLVDNNPFAVFSVDRDGYFQTANEQTGILAAISADKLIGKHFNEFIQQKDSTRVQKSFIQNLQGIRTVDEFHTLDVNGNEHILKISGIPIIISGVVEGVYSIAEDITEKVKAEQELRKTQQIISAYFNSTGDGIIIADKDYSIVAFNAKANNNTEAVLGKSLFAGAKLIDYTVASTIGDFLVDYDRAIAGEMRTVEFSLGEGENKSWWRILYIPVEAPESNNRLVAFVAQNTTDIIKAEYEIRNKEQILDAYFNSTADSIIITDHQSNIVAFNKVAATESLIMLNLPLKIGRSINNYSELINNPEHNKNMVTALKGSTVTFERNIAFKEQSSWKHISYIPIANRITSEGNYFIAYVVSDITNRKKLELSLREYTKTLERVTTLSPIIVSVTDVKTGNTIYSGASLLEKLGYPHDEISYLDTVTIEERNKRLIPYDADTLKVHLEQSEQLVDGDDEKVLFRAKNFWGGLEWVELRTAVFSRDESQKATQFVHAFNIVTEQVNLTIKLKELMDRLEERVMERTNDLLMILDNKNSLIELLSHDVRNKLGGIYLQGELLELHSPKMLPDKINLVGKSIKSLTTNITQLLDDVIETRRLDEGVFSLHKIFIDAKDIIVMAISGVHAHAANKEVEIILEECSGIVETDPNLSKELMENFLSNAIKFSPKSSRIWVGSKISENDVILYVRDEGPGIRQEEMSRLFVRFGKLSARPTNGENSTGLGLAITKQLAKMLGGHVWCVSEEGKGSTFFVTLPKSAHG